MQTNPYSSLARENPSSRRPLNPGNGDAFVGVERLKLAKEKSVRANLQKLVEDLYTLPGRPPLMSSLR